MACFHPMKGYRSSELTDKGKRRIVFNLGDAIDDKEITFPCGQCIGCRLERSRQWAIRCVHEAQMHESNCFITLTYDDNVPDDGSLDKSHYQKFMKRLRKRFSGKRIRYFHCGEYGDTTFRPHYHACIFGFDFPDKELYSTRDDVRLYTSDVLRKLWPYGFSTIGDVTFDSAAYVARYVMKKVTGDASKAHYEYIDPSSGEVHDRQPEYTTMSRRPGIGRDWYDKYKDDVFPDDFLIVNGVRMKPPKYYEGVFEVEGGVDYDWLKFEREKAAEKSADDNTYDRLRAREVVKFAQLGMLKRNLE